MQCEKMTFDQRNKKSRTDENKCSAKYNVIIVIFSSASGGCVWVWVWVHLCDWHWGKRWQKLNEIPSKPIPCRPLRPSFPTSLPILLPFSKLKHFILNGLQSLRSELWVCAAQISIPFICSNFFSPWLLLLQPSIVTPPCCRCYSFICTIVSQMNLAVSNITTVTDMSSSSVFVCASSPVVGNIYTVDSGEKWPRRSAL